MKIFVPYCEWDIGLYDAYKTYEGFVEHAKELLSLSDIEETFEDLEDGGLIGGTWKPLGP